MTYLGDFNPGDVVRFMWNSNGADGGSITRSTNGTISVYQNLNTTQSTAGVTDTEDFDTLTGVHACAIDTSADGTFYAAGRDFAVVLSAAVIDGVTVNAVLAHFSVQNRLLSAGKIATDAITAAKIAADAITAAKIADGAIDANTFATGAITAAAIAADAIGASELAADAVTEIQSGLSTLNAAGIRSAVGLASANLDTQLSAIDDFLDTEVAAIKAKTDQLTFTGANRVDANVAAVNANTTAPVTLERSARGIVRGTVGSASTTTSIVTSSLAPAAAVTDQFKGRIVTFDDSTTTAALRGQSTDITGMTSGGVLTVTALTTAPASGDTFTIN